MSTRDRSPVTGIMLALVGGWVFAQTVMGGAVARLTSYADPTTAPDNTGPTGSVARRPRRARGRGRISITPGVLRGDPIVLRTIAPAVAAAGIDVRVISWYRPGATVAGSGSPSCHRHGKRSGRGAVDLIPRSGDWGDLDLLDTELRQTPGIGEIVWRGDSDHDPAAGAKVPHLHAAVRCG